MIKEIISQETVPIDFDLSQYNQLPCCDVYSTDLLIHCTDIHTGIEIHNWKNNFDGDILKERLEKFTNNILEIRNTHNSGSAYIVIGEILSGIIHNNLRLQNNMDLIEQFKYVAELLSVMLTTLSSSFKCVHVYVTPGNHSRVSPKKEDSLDGENMDVLLPFYLKARLQNFENIVIHENNVEPEIAMFNVGHTKVFALHGHKDSPSNVVQNLTMMFGMKPDIVLMGHRHTNAMLTVSDTKVIQSGCISGSDNYATSIRKCNKPEQTVSVIGYSGLQCVYDIQLD